MASFVGFLAAHLHTITPARFYIGCRRHFVKYGKNGRNVAFVFFQGYGKKNQTPKPDLRYLNSHLNRLFPFRYRYLISGILSLVSVANLLFFRVNTICVFAIPCNQQYIQWRPFVFCTCQRLRHWIALIYQHHVIFCSFKKPLNHTFRLIDADVQPLYTVQR